MAQNLGQGAAVTASRAAVSCAISTRVGGVRLVGELGRVGMGMADMSAVGADVDGGLNAIATADLSAFGTIRLGAVGGIHQALVEFESKLREIARKAKFAAVEIEEALHAKATFHRLTDSPASYTRFVSRKTSVDRVPRPPIKFQWIDKNKDLMYNEKSPQMWKCVNTIKGHVASINSFAISPDGKVLASGSDDKTISLWNLKTGKRIFSFFGAKKVYSVAISPDSQMLVSGDGDRQVTTWSLDKKQILRSFSYLASTSHAGVVYAVAFSPDGKTLISGSGDRTIRLWNIETGKLIRIFNGHSKAVFALAIAPDGQTLVSGSADQTIGIWNLNSYQLPCILKGHSGWVFSVAIAPNAETIASGSADGTVKLWNLRSGQLLRTLPGHSGPVFSVAIAPDGKTLASGSNNGTVKFWNLSSGELMQTLAGYNPVAFSAVEPIFITGGNGGAIQIWHQIWGENERTTEPILSGEWWEVLGVDRLANVEEVKLVYHRLARQYHPDLNPSASAIDRMQAINRAYEKFLSDFGNTRS